MTEEALIAAAKSDLLDVSEMTVPMLKIGQSLTREVTEGDAQPGDLIHSVTGEVYGKSVQLIVVDSFKGRAWRNPEDRSFHVANRGEVVVPWEEHSCFGQHFTDCPDAEEQYRARVQANEIDWGKGPGIATTYNFIGLILHEDGQIDQIPVRISLMKSAAKEGRNWQTILRLNRAPWDVVFELSTSMTRNKAGEPYTAVKVRQLRRTSDEEKLAALEVAQAIHTSTVRYDDALEEETPVMPSQPEASGGLEI